MTFRILTETGNPLITEGLQFLVIQYGPATPEVDLDFSLTERGFGESVSPMRCPMCDGDLINLYGLRCRRCGTRIVRFPGREIT